MYQNAVQSNEMQLISMYFTHVCTIMYIVCMYMRKVSNSDLECFQHMI